MHIHLTMHTVMDATAYWAFGWNLIYVLCPPRENFHSPGYNKFLDLVSYYGSLNIRSLFMKFYGAQPQEAPSTNPGGSTPPTPPAAH